MAGLAAAFGSGAMTNDIAGIKEADVILIIGSDTSAAHPVIAARIKQALRFGKTKLIVIDPKEIEMANTRRFTPVQRCGNRCRRLERIMHEIIKNEWYDKEYVAERCEASTTSKRRWMDYPPEKVEQISGVPAQQFREMAEMFGKA